MRVKPNPRRAKSARSARWHLPPQPGCQGGLTFQEFTELSPRSGSSASGESRWCQVEYQGITGWSPGATGEATAAAEAAARKPIMTSRNVQTPSPT